MKMNATAATLPFRILRPVALFLLAACGSVPAQSPPNQATDAAVAELGAGLAHFMFYAPPLEGKAWGADLPKSPVMLNP